MKLYLPEVTQALLIAHIANASVTLFAIPILLNDLGVDGLRTWVTWTSSLVWFNAFIDSGISQAAFRSVAEADSASDILRRTHVLVVIARIFLVPIAVLMHFVIVAPDWRVSLAPPAIIAVLGLILSAAWALPLLSKPRRCVIAVCAVQLASLFAYWMAGQFRFSLLAYAWIFSVTQFIVGAIYILAARVESENSIQVAFSFQRGFNLLKQSVPLSIASVITLPYSSAVPLVSAFMSSVELAQFAIVERLVKAVQALQVPISQSLLLETYRLRTTSTACVKERLIYVLCIQLAFAVACSVGLTLIGSWLVELWTARSWPEITLTVVALSGAMICTAATNTINQHLFIPERRDRDVLMIISGACGLSLLLLPHVAGNGATAVASAILFVECSVLAAYVITWRLKRKIG